MPTMMLHVRPLTTSTYIPTEPTYERHMHHSCIVQWYGVEYLQDQIYEVQSA